MFIFISIAPLIIILLVTFIGILSYLNKDLKYIKKSGIIVTANILDIKVEEKILNEKGSLNKIKNVLTVEYNINNEDRTEKVIINRELENNYKIELIYNPKQNMLIDKETIRYNKKIYMVLFFIVISIIISIISFVFLDVLQMKNESRFINIMLLIGIVDTMISTGTLLNALKLFYGKNIIISNAEIIDFYHDIHVGTNNKSTYRREYKLLTNSNRVSGKYNIKYNFDNFITISSFNYDNRRENEIGQHVKLLIADNLIIMSEDELKKTIYEGVIYALAGILMIIAINLI